MLNFRFLILSLLFSGVSLFTMGNEDTLRVLFVGNSYTYYNNLPQLVSILSEQTGTKLITQKSVVGGGETKRALAWTKRFKNQRDDQNWPLRYRCPSGVQYGSH